MANQVDIVLKAVDKASGEINKVTGAGNKLAAGFKSLTGITLGAGAALAGIGAAAKFIGDAVNETVEYATEIDNTARLLGLTTEETSRLVQASDDLFISQEKLSSGLQAATRQGIDVSIEGLKKLSEQYLALPAGIERSEFVLKTFGRSGAEMGKLMEVGADGIDAATAAIADNMVITDQSYEDIMDYKRSVDNLNDSWQGFKYTVGTQVIPILDDLLTYINESASGSMKFSQSTANWLNKIFEGTGLESDYAVEQRHLVELGEAMNKEYGVLNGAFSETNTQLVGLGTNTSTVTQYFQLLNEQMVFNKLAANMTEDAAMALGVQMGLLDPMTYSLSLKMEELTAKYDLNHDEVIDAKEATAEYYEEVRKLQDTVNGLQDKTINIVVNWAGEGGGGIGNAELLANYDLNGNGVIGKAAGGLGGGRTLVGEFGPEVVDLPPGSRVHNATNSAQMGTSGGGFTDRDLRKLARYIAEESARSGR